MKSGNNFTGKPIDLLNKGSIKITEDRLLYGIFFLSAFTPLDFLGVSLSFYLFIGIIYLRQRRNDPLFKISKPIEVILVLFGAGVFIGYLFSNETFREYSFLAQTRLLIQYFYWIVIVLYIFNRREFDLFYFSKAIFWGLVLHIIFQHFLSPLGLPVSTQNGFAYTMNTLVPIAFIYSMLCYSFTTNVMLGIGYFFAILVTGARAGSLVVGTEVILVFLLAYKGWRRLLLHPIFLIIGFTLLVGITSQEKFVKDVRYELADYVESYNTRLADMLKNFEKLDERDKSWITRLMARQKAMKIFNDDPFTGVGVGQFENVYKKLEPVSRFAYIWNSPEYYNMRTAHNSYIMILAENGLLGAVPLGIFIIVVFWYNYKNARNSVDLSYLLLVSMLGMLAHFWTIASITGTLTWSLFGIYLKVSLMNRQKNVLNVKKFS